MSKYFGIFAIAVLCCGIAPRIVVEANAATPNNCRTEEHDETLTTLSKKANKTRVVAGNLSSTPIIVADALSDKLQRLLNKEKPPKPEQPAPNDSRRNYDLLGATPGMELNDAVAIIKSDLDSQSLVSIYLDARPIIEPIMARKGSLGKCYPISFAMLDSVMLRDKTQTIHLYFDRRDPKRKVHTVTRMLDMTALNLDQNQVMEALTAKYGAANYWKKDYQKDFAEWALANPSWGSCRLNLGDQVGSFIIGKRDLGPQSYGDTDCQDPTLGYVMERAENAASQRSHIQIDPQHPPTFLHFLYRETADTNFGISGLPTALPITLPDEAFFSEYPLEENLTALLSQRADFPRDLVNKDDDCGSFAYARFWTHPWSSIYNDATRILARTEQRGFVFILSTNWPAAAANINSAVRDMQVHQRNKPSSGDVKF